MEKVELRKEVVPTRFTVQMRGGKFDGAQVIMTERYLDETGNEVSKREVKQDLDKVDQLRAILGEQTAAILADAQRARNQLQEGTVKLGDQEKLLKDEIAEVHSKISADIAEHEDEKQLFRRQVDELRNVHAWLASVLQGLANQAEMMNRINKVLNQSPSDAEESNVEPPPEAPNTKSKKKTAK